MGGRCATRRIDATLAFDHGAQYFTAKTDPFRAQVQSWLSHGIAAEWTGKIVKLSHHGLTDASPRQRYVGLPGMSALGADLAQHLPQPLTIHRETTIKRVVRQNARWTLLDQNDTPHGPFDFLVVSLPAPQCAEILKDHALAHHASAVAMEPCWAVMMAFSEKIAVPWDAAFVADNPISWIARNSSKPGRPQGPNRSDCPDCWVLHASPTFSTANLEQPAEKIAETLTATLADLIRIKLPPTVYRAAHRWRFAQASTTTDALHRFDPDTQLALCGDWLAGGKIESAYLSGESAAHAIAQHIKI